LNLATRVEQLCLRGRDFVALLDLQVELARLSFIQLGSGQYHLR
jgi:hypothetical protein